MPNLPADLATERPLPAPSTAWSSASLGASLGAASQPSPAHRLLSLLACAVALLLAACGGGGGGATSDAVVGTPVPAPGLVASQLAVLYADGDATSESIARAYQQARGIPESQMIRVILPAGVGDAIPAADFAPVKAAIDAQLPANVQATLVTWSKPSRVVGTCSMGITSALAFGYDARWCGGCVATPASAYYNSATHTPWTTLQLRPSMMLGTSTLADAQLLIARGLAADASWTGSNPSTGQALLVRTSDAARSVRFADFVALAGTTVPGLLMRYIDNSQSAAADEVSGQTGVMFYFTGLAAVHGAATNTYLPGAVADTLTSYGGILPDGAGQMPITDWIRAGLTGSYGTVEEPCNYVEKFSRATVLVGRYRQGDTLIEAYWKSVEWPGQGLFVGDPLAHPWASR